MVFKCQYVKYAGNGIFCSHLSSCWTRLHIPWEMHTGDAGFPSLFHWHLRKLSEDHWSVASELHFSIETPCVVSLASPGSGAGGCLGHLPVVWFAQSFLCREVLRDRCYGFLVSPPLPCGWFCLNYLVTSSICHVDSANIFLVSKISVYVILCLFSML